MWLEEYEFWTSEDGLDYVFYSKSPKGIVKKIVQFRPWNSDGQTYYNLVLGDWNERIKRLDDRIVTNNMDKQKVLATVGAIVLKFTGRFPNKYVHARGRTASRTRLFQIGISSNWEQIDHMLFVFGFINNGWERFRKNVNYEAFLVKRK